MFSHLTAVSKSNKGFALFISEVEVHFEIAVIPLKVLVLKKQILVSSIIVAHEKR